MQVQYQMLKLVSFAFFLGRTIHITPFLPGLIQCLNFLIFKLFPILQLLFLNLLHINHQPVYVDVTYQHCSSSLFV